MGLAIQMRHYQVCLVSTQASVFGVIGFVSYCIGLIKTTAKNQLKMMKVKQNDN